MSTTTGTGRAEVLYDDYLAGQHPYPAHVPGQPIYLTGCHCAASAQLAGDGARVGLMLTPGAATGHAVPIYRWWAVDNGCFSQGASFDAGRWLAWLATNPDPTGCLFVVAPDVLDPATGRGDPEATWHRSEGFFEAIRSLGYPVALALQDGAEGHVATWDEIDRWDAAFIAGSTGWKLSQAAKDCAAEAMLAHKWVHVGRVNSWRRIHTLASWRVDSVDGTYLKHGPDINGRHLTSWLARLDQHQPLFRDYYPLAEPGDSRNPACADPMLP